MVGVLVIPYKMKKVKVLRLRSLELQNVRKKKPRKMTPAPRLEAMFEGYCVCLGVEAAERDGPPEPVVTRTRC